MENKEHILNTVKRIITEEVEKAGYKVESVYLFGSRARADYKEDSDWDFFVVINQNISFKDERHLIAKIKKIMAELKIRNDILINSKNELNENNNVGNIAYYALKYGVMV